MSNNLYRPTVGMRGMNCTDKVGHASFANRRSDHFHGTSGCPSPTSTPSRLKFMKKDSVDGYDRMNKPDRLRRTYCRLPKEVTKCTEKLHEAKSPLDSSQKGRMEQADREFSAKTRSQEPRRTPGKSVRFQEHVSIHVIPSVQSADDAVQAETGCFSSSDSFRKRKLRRPDLVENWMANGDNANLEHFSKQERAKVQSCEQKSPMATGRETSSILRKDYRVQGQHERNIGLRSGEGVDIANGLDPQTIRGQRNFLLSCMPGYSRTFPILSQITRHFPVTGKSVLRWHGRNTLSPPVEIDFKRCPFCLVAVYQEDFSKHRVEHEEEDGAGNCRCILCQETILDLISLLNHYLTVHSGCPFCRVSWQGHRKARSHIIRCGRKAYFHGL